MSKLFGTDGVRGVAGVDLTAELALNLGRAAARVLGRVTPQPNVVIGRDTRVSSHFLEAALAAGLLSAGAGVLYAGVVPTPAVAFLVTHYLAEAGGVISGSHNPARDNGIKFFGGDGHKLTDAGEEEIEAAMEVAAQFGSVEAMGIGRTISEAEDLYVAHVLKALDDRKLDGIKVALDCANGSAFRTSPRALAEAGAEVLVINDKPDGTNINLECGSTSPEVIAKEVKRGGADVGLAHDGDADRVLAVDENGDLVDGDAIIAALAIELKEKGRLKENLVVSTVMANLGFRRAMQAHEIRIVEVPVGDRYVIEAMRDHGAVIGGEQSGHVIFTDYSTTGDGLISALRLLARMASTGKSLSELGGVVEKFPQVLLNVNVSRPERVESAEKVLAAVRAARKRLGDSGRVLVRPSGTEPLVRVMVEAGDETTTRAVAEEIASVVEQALGGDA